VNESTEQSDGQDGDGDENDDIGVDDYETGEGGIHDFFTMFRFVFDVEFDESLHILIAGKDERVFEAADKLDVSTAGLSSPAQLTYVFLVGFVAVVDVLA
jgi:hypothetical protein